MVVEGGLPPDYVLDRMELYEVPHLVKAIEQKRRPQWEQARMISLVVANAFGAKIKPKHLPFPWDEEKAETEKVDVKAMRKKLNELKKKKNAV